MASTSSGWRRSRHSRSLGVDPFALLDRAKASGSAGEVVGLELFGGDDQTTEQVMLVGLGQQETQDYRRAGAVIARAARKRGPIATSIGALADDDQLAAFSEGLVLGAFGFHRKSGESKTPQSPIVVLSDMPTTKAERVSRDAIVATAVTRAKASWRSRAFALTPSNEKGPARLEQWARDAAKSGGLDVTVWDEKRLARGRLRRHPRGRARLGVRVAVHPARLHAQEGRRDAPHTWCSSARASRSTPAASRSSRATRWRP